MDETPRDLLSITEVGEATGLNSSALRYYESAGLISPKARIGGRRHYDPAVFQRLAVIGLLQEAGFTIGEIAEVISKKRAWRDLAARKLEDIDAHLERVEATREFLQAALDCGCSGLETCGLVDQRPARHRRAAQVLSVGMNRFE